MYFGNLSVGEINILYLNFNIWFIVNLFNDIRWTQQPGRMSSAQRKDTTTH